MRSELFDAIRDATRDEFDLVSELGGGESWILFLGAALDQSGLALLLVQEAEEGGGEFDLEVIPTLEAGIPAGLTTCGTCGAAEAGWPRFCARCGADLSGVQPDAEVPGASAAELLDEVRSAADGEFRVMGAMPHTEGGGALYFAVEEATGRVVGLSLQEAGGELALTVSWTPEAITEDAASVVVDAAPTAAPLLVEEIVLPAGQTDDGPAPPPLWDPPSARSRVRSRERGRRTLGIAAAGVVGLALVAALILFVSGRSVSAGTASTAVLPDPEPAAGAGVGNPPPSADGEVAKQPGSSEGTPTTPISAFSPSQTQTQTAQVPPRIPPQTAQTPQDVPQTPQGLPTTAQSQVAPPVEPGPDVATMPTAAGVEVAVRRYTQAVASCQTSRISRAYPGITEAEVVRWENFFRRNCGAGLRAEFMPETEPVVDGTRAELVFTLGLSYSDATGRTVDQPLPMRAVLEWRQGAWSLREVRSLAGR